MRERNEPSRTNIITNLREVLPCPGLAAGTGTVKKDRGTRLKRYDYFPVDDPRPVSKRSEGSHTVVQSTQVRKYCRFKC